MVPPAAAVCAWDQTGGPDTLFVSDSDVLRTVDGLDDKGADAISPPLVGDLLGAPVSGAAPGWSSPGVSPGSITLTQNWADVAADGVDFQAGGGVILVDTQDDTGRVACGIIGSIGGNTLVNVNWNGTQIGPVPSGTVLAIPAHVYSINAPAGATPQLVRDGLVLAEDIEDFQVALYFDEDGDRDVGPDETYGDGVDAAGGNNSSDYDPALTDGQELREVRINLVAVTRDPDPRQDYQQGLPQATENRVLGAPTADRFRRRVHTSTVRLRNVGNV
jgi:hypothetical protein